MIQVHQVFQETEVLQDHLALEFQDPQERKVFKAFQEDLEVPAHLVLKVNQACQWLKKAYQDPEDRTAHQDCLVHQVAQVSLDSLVSLVFQEQRVILDSQELDSQDPQDLKDTQVSPASQESLQDLADQE